MKKRIIIELTEEEFTKFLPSLLFTKADFSVRSVEPSLSEKKIADEKPHILRQRRSPDGRTSMQVVLDKVGQFGGKKFHNNEIESVARYTGFSPHTLRINVTKLIAEGRLRRVGAEHLQTVTEN